MRKRGPVVYTQLQNGEQMKEIEGFPQYYITNIGRVLSTRPLGSYNTTPSELREITLSYIDSKRYDYCNIYNEHGVRCSLRVHRLVWQYFNPNGESFKEGYVIDHIDNNKTNNHISNLQQITSKENSNKYHKSKKQFQINE